MAKETNRTRIMTFRVTPGERAIIKREMFALKKIEPEITESDIIRYKLLVPLSPIDQKAVIACTKADADPTHWTKQSLARPSSTSSPKIIPLEWGEP